MVCIPLIRAIKPNMMLKLISVIVQVFTHPSLICFLFYCGSILVKKKRQTIKEYFLQMAAHLILVRKFTFDGTCIINEVRLGVPLFIVILLRYTCEYKNR